MRYFIQPMIVGKNHQFFPLGTIVYFLLDTFDNRLSLSYYTKEETAKYWCDKKNGTI